MTAAFVARAHEANPDLGGTRVEYDRVLEAARTLGLIGPAAMHSATSTDLVTQRDGGDLTTVATNQLALARVRRDQRKLRTEEAEQEISEIVGVHVDPLQRAKRRFAWLGGISTIIGVVALLLRSNGLGLSRADTNTLTLAGAIVAITGLAVSAVAGITALRVQSLENTFQDVEAVLSKRSTVARVLRQILPNKPVLTDLHVSEEHLVAAVSDWASGASPFRPMLVPVLPFLSPRRTALKTLARRIGYEAFAGVLIAKGKETNILLEEEDIDDAGDLVTGYCVQVTPLQVQGEETEPPDD